MESGHHIAIARFQEADETREVYLVQRARGGLHIRQLSWGRLTQLAFGESAVCQQLTLEAGQLARLAERLGWGAGVQEGLRSFFADGGAALSDLLDVCSACGIACTYSAVGRESGSLSAAGGVSEGGAPEARCGMRPALSLVP